MEYQSIEEKKKPPRLLITDHESSHTRVLYSNVKVKYSLYTERNKLKPRHRHTDIYMYRIPHHHSIAQSKIVCSFKDEQVVENLERYYLLLMNNWENNKQMMVEDEVSL